jgi:hypothetical protein
VFVRGPDSDSAGEATLIAYDDGSARVAYASFPLLLLEDTDMELLIRNAMAWFTGEFSNITSARDSRMTERESSSRFVESAKIEPPLSTSDSACSRFIPKRSAAKPRRANRVRS